MIRNSTKVICTITHILDKPVGGPESYEGTGATKRVAGARAMAELVKKHPLRSGFATVRISFHRAENET